MGARPMMGELMLTAFDYAPQGWALCNGQLMPINQYRILFEVLGTTYGGNGQTTFALPDLRGRVPISTGGGSPQGTKLGQEHHFLRLGEMPQHEHKLLASSSDATQPNPVGAVLAGGNNVYGPPPEIEEEYTELRPTTVTSYGGGQRHENRPPYVVLNWCIALYGAFPSPTPPRPPQTHGYE